MKQRQRDREKALLSFVSNQDASISLNSVNGKDKPYNIQIILLMHRRQVYYYPINIAFYVTFFFPVAYKIPMIDWISILTIHILIYNK